jgi:hypothetical protein
MPGSSKKRTRHSSSTRLDEYLGPGTELLRTEVPTLRDILRKELLIQEEKMLSQGGDRTNYPVRQMIEELATVKSNYKFKTPVVSDRKNVLRRLMSAWENINSIALKRETKQSVVSFW